MLLSSSNKYFLEREQKQTENSNFFSEHDTNSQGSQECSNILFSKSSFICFLQPAVLLQWMY